MDLVFQQANESLKAFSLEDREALIYNLVESLMFVDGAVQEKVVNYFTMINEELGNTIQKQLY